MSELSGDQEKAIQYAAIRRMEEIYGLCHESKHFDFMYHFISGARFGVAIEKARSQKQIETLEIKKL